MRKNFLRIKWENVKFWPLDYLCAATPFPAARSMFSPELSSRSSLFGSGRRNIVNINPMRESPASTTNRPDSDMVLIIATLSRVPTNAPILPPAADAPLQNPLTLVGNTSGGYMKVVTLGPNSMKK